MDAAYRRVEEELGCRALDLAEIGSFVDHARFADGIVEHEYDHILLGRFAGELDPDPAEISDTCWLDAEGLSRELMYRPDGFAVWAPIVLSRALQEMTGQE